MAVVAEDARATPRQAASGLAVRARGVRRAFSSRTVLDGIDLDLRRGEFVALLGASGTGKSTLLRIFAGIDTDAEGELDLPDVRAVVFQDPRLLPWKRVAANVAIGLGRDDVASRPARALEEVGLAGHAGAWPKTLSGGEAQRVALARALVREPELLLLDEPFGALDALTRIQMHRLLVDLCDRHRPATLLVTHDVDEALMLADRVLVLSDGVLALDTQVALDAPRRRDAHDFVALRRRLLSELGVDELLQ